MLYSLSGSWILNYTDNLSQISQTSMQVKTRREKVNEVAAEIEKRAERNDLGDLKYEVLVDELSDGQYNEGEIEDIIDELIEESPFKSANMNFRVVYPNTHEEELFTKFEFISSHDTFEIFAVGAYSFFMILVGTSLFNDIFGMSDIKLFIVTISGIVLSYGLGKTILGLKIKVERQIPVIRKYRIVIYPFVGLMSISVIIVSAQAALGSGNLSTAALVTIPPTCFGAAVAFATFLKKFDIDPDLDRD